ncbi:tyrosine-type recombinase/integrase [Mesorhizobium sp. B1-1-2]|uniref:tyrosine-type recombinase/integrase n=1 Tax=Mesorhizobium sp. B1-1-2 TaxID=2589982 RepID=UPI001129E714|nr:tyrosine-type recombinase/integrase [Mesorhizobium sp. B1-1-2]TPN80000.1 integrase [Mesorhizobium sp. B1-1-2]
MGRNRKQADERKDDDRYLATINGYYWYKRRVPKLLAHLDARAPQIRMSLKTREKTLARRKRDQLEAADDTLWASYIVDGQNDPARLRYDAAVRRVEAMDFSFHSSAVLEKVPDYEELQRRFAAIKELGVSKDVGLPLLGGVNVPKTSVTKAFDIYCNEIVADELVGKSQVQKAQWKKVKQRAVNNFIRIAGSDKAMEDITVDDAKKVYLHWLARIVPKKGEPQTASANSGNRDLGNMRVLFEAYFKYQGDSKRPNPFDGFSFSRKNKRSRPPIPTEWIRDTILKPGALAGMNEEARGVLLIMIETGARPSEICNMEPSAIRWSAKVPHVSIEPREDPDDPREIKTESSRRLVPLVGVALAAAERHKAGFPRYRDRENDLSATVNKFLSENGLFPTKAHKFYSFRHSFEDRMKEGGIDAELRKILMGHTVDRPKYGSGGGLEWRREQLMRIALPFDPSIV